MCSKSVIFSKSNTAETQIQLEELFLCFCYLRCSYIPFWNLTKFLEILDHCFSCRNRHRNNAETELSRAIQHDDGVDVSVPQLFDYLSNTPSNASLVPDGVPTNVKKWAPDGTAPKVFEVSNIQF